MRKQKGPHSRAKACVSAASVPVLLLSTPVPQCGNDFLVTHCFGTGPQVAIGVGVGVGVGVPLLILLVLVVVMMKRRKSQEVSPA